MGKKNKGAGKASSQVLVPKPSNIGAPSSIPITATTTSAVASDAILGYKARVLLHDFLNATKGPNSEKRINFTTDEHYISSPYFDENQAATIKGAIIDVAIGSEENESNDPTIMVCQQGQSFETAIRTLLDNFLEKRRASGDARPCGPHHLAPMYAKLFGVDMKELEDAKFLSRLRRTGV
ncbi:hypothetical protein NW762_009735 [Fusarium torreyae]|uniref:Uncharacterized protein n=1 Tax=Fusarium torreyae TaxID=1237075 RepID=A0A9W8RUX3_9HYPO|nr:hypothetical protein NW762_009735 [Fusarium torreyae]